MTIGVPGHCSINCSLDRLRGSCCEDVELALCLNIRSSSPGIKVQVCIYVVCLRVALHLIKSCAILGCDLVPDAPLAVCVQGYCCVPECDCRGHSSVILCSICALVQQLQLQIAELSSRFPCHGIDIDLCACSSPAGDEDARSVRRICSCVPCTSRDSRYSSIIAKDLDLVLSKPAIVYVLCSYDDPCLISYAAGDVHSGLQALHRVSLWLVVCKEVVCADEVLNIQFSRDPVPIWQGIQLRCVECDRESHSDS